TQTPTLSLHDALPISRIQRESGYAARGHVRRQPRGGGRGGAPGGTLSPQTLRRRAARRSSQNVGFTLDSPACGTACRGSQRTVRSEEHTSELQSPYDL